MHKIEESFVLRDHRQKKISFHKSFINTYRKRLCNDGGCSSITYEKRN